MVNIVEVESEPEENSAKSKKQTPVVPTSTTTTNGQKSAVKDSDYLAPPPVSEGDITTSLDATAKFEMLSKESKTAPKIKSNTNKVDSYEVIAKGPVEALSPEKMEEAKKYKEEGNNYFKQGYYEEALECYTKALKVNPCGGVETCVYLKNRAACLLKMERYEEAARDCTAALDIVPRDPKALFRRCQAFEGMEKYEEAYRDGTTLFKMDPKNTAIQPILRRLGPIVQKRLEQQTLTGNKMKQMFELCFDNSSGDDEKRKQAANNLIVLAREEAGAQQMFECGAVENFITLINDKDPELQLIAFRALGAMVQNSKKRAVGIFNKVTLEKIIVMMSINSEEISAAAANLLRNMITSMTNITHYQEEKAKHEEKRKDVSLKLRPYPHLGIKIAQEHPDIIPYLDKIFDAFIKMLPSKKVSKYGRDNAMEIIIKFAPNQTGVGQSIHFMGRGGLQGLLEVSGTIPEHKTIPVSDNSRLHASLALAKIWDDLFQENDQKLYRERVDAYFDDMFGDNIMESKLEAVMALAALLQGPYDVGNHILARPGVLEIIMAMADSDNAMHVKYAVEALVHSASKKDRATGVIKEATPILKQLYSSKNEYIKVRALVGLCKLGSFGGGDISAKTYAEGSTQTLAKACRKFLKNPAKDVDLRKWAAEGLAYLTLDADVKEELIDDEDAIRSMMELSKLGDMGTVYPIAQVFVNVTNSYEKKDPSPELVELAKFAKHHVPVDHEKDKEPYIGERTKKLVKLGLINALVNMSKTESNNTKELLSRVYWAVSQDPEHRGLMVQQGAAKYLIDFANDGTPNGKTKAAQALAKIAVTNNPEIAFPGQRACEVVRPLILLLDVEKETLENFEALLALTNLASMNDTVRKRILKEKGFGKIEFYAYDDHEQLKRAALECINNLLMCEETINFFKGRNDRVKYFVLMCLMDEMETEDDFSTVRACAGALAIMTYNQREICGKVTTSTSQWVDILAHLAASPIPELSHRGMHILMNMCAVDKEIAATVAMTKLLEVIMAVARLDDPERQAACRCAEKCLESLRNWELVQLTEDGKTWQKDSKLKKKEEEARKKEEEEKKKAFEAKKREEARRKKKEEEAKEEETEKKEEVHKKQEGVMEKAEEEGKNKTEEDVTKEESKDEKPEEEKENIEEQVLNITTQSEEKTQAEREPVQESSNDTSGGKLEGSHSQCGREN